MPDFKELVNRVKSPENIKRIKDDTVRFNMYQGQVRNAIRHAIQREFEKPETIHGLQSRIVPVNIMQKIINKLAAVYQQSPSRTPLDKNVNDQELIDLYEKPFKINQNMKFANRFFKLDKHVALEPFLDHKGMPRMRALPSQNYTPIGDDPIEPQRVTTFVKHIKVDDLDPKKTRLQVWTDEQFVIVDGHGLVVMEEMVALNNPDMVNPFGVIPFTYISETDDGNLIPIPDDDLVSMQITIPLLLTDLSFASKFQLWSILAIIGADGENVTFNPNSIMSLPNGADVKVIKPEVDIDQGLRQVEALIAMLLTTKNLSVGDVSGQLSTANMASGVAKLLDKAETTEDRKDQEEFFRNGEMEFWNKYAHNILPVWVESGEIDRKFAGSFTEDFELSIKFADPKPFIGDKDRVDLEVTKLDNSLTTEKMALQVIHPEMDGEQINDLVDELGKEKKEKVQAFSIGSDDGDDDEKEEEEE